MSSNITISPEQFSKTVMKALAEYGDDVTELLERETKSVSRQAAKEIKSQSPGQYARGWSHKAQKSGPNKLAEVVYNRTDYQLTHLLEKPHTTGHGGHYPKNVDYTGIIANAEEKYTNKFMEEVLSKL